MTKKPDMLLGVTKGFPYQGFSTKFPMKFAESSTHRGGVNPISSNTRIEIIPGGGGESRKLGLI